MCGRYTIAKPERIVIVFEPDVVTSDLGRPRYNIAPSQPVPALFIRDGEKVLADLQWGLVPHWAKDPMIGNKMINARAETVHEKPSYRSSFRRRRCLVPADGFYEWQRVNGGKQPMYVRVDDGEPFAFAGLHAAWSGGDEDIRSCTIITTAPNDLMASIHNRMPVILPRDTWQTWLDPEQKDLDMLRSFLVPFDETRMAAHPVSTFVNSPANDDERCVAPFEQGELNL